MRPMENILSFCEITRRFGPVVANDEVKLDIREGEIHGLVGQNGAGKSTLMKILFGMVEPDKGRVIYRGKPVHLSSPHEAVSHGIGMVQQALCLAERMDIMENIIAGEEPHRRGVLKRREAEARLRTLMDELGCSLPLHQTVEQARLGIAQRQLVEILRLLWRKVSLIVLDEPTSSLGPVEIEALFKILKKLKEQKVTVIIISHRLSEILGIADRITVMREGKVMGTVERSEASEDELARLMFGSLAKAGRTSPETCNVPVLQVERLEGEVLRGLSFTVNEGEVFGVAALPGNGGEELGQILGGTMNRKGGKITLNGSMLTNMCPRVLTKAGLAYVPEDSIGEGTVPTFSVAENFVLGRIEEFCRRLFSFSLIHWRRILRSSKVLKETFGVRYQNPKQPVSTLSGGNIQKLMLARAISANPKILVLMHPTRGLDVHGARQVGDWLLERLGDENSALKGVVIISPDLEELLGACHRILVMYRGRSLGVFDGTKLDDVDIGEMGRLLTGKGDEEVNSVKGVRSDPHKTAA